MSTVIIATDDGRNSSYAELREAALGWASEQGMRVVLYDRSAESYFVDPYPSGGWTADVESGPKRRTLLEPADLELLGRHYLAQQVTEARGRGLEASAWLPSSPGPRGMAEAVEACSAETLLLPAAIEKPSLVDRVSGNTLQRIGAAVSARIGIGDRGGIRMVGAGVGG